MGQLNVICIDGISGVGKSSQTGLLYNLLKSHNIECFKVNFSSSNSEDIMVNILDIQSLLRLHKDGIVICEGSIASHIVRDIVDNTHQDELFKKYNELIRIYRELNSNYNISNIILNPLNMEFCKKRLYDRDKLNGTKTEFNHERNSATSLGLSRFNNNVLSFNMDFESININGKENMLQVHNKIIDLIAKKYQIKSPC